MTSPDGGGSAENGPQPDGPSEGDRRNGPTPHDDDPVRLAPPADPWLAEAPTSAFGDATPAPAADAAPGTDTARFTDTAGLIDTAHGPRQRRRGRRASRWVVAALAACALFIAGMLAVDRFRSPDDGNAQPSDPSTGATAGTGSGQKRVADPPAAVGGVVPSTGITTSPQPDTATDGQPESSVGAAAPETSADAAAAQVVYRVTASGSRNVGSVSYTDQDGDIIRLNGIPLPWRVTFSVGGQRQPLVLIAQRKGGGDAGPVTCTITVGGKLLSSTTANGRYAAPQCSGSG